MISIFSKSLLNKGSFKGVTETIKQCLASALIFFALSFMSHLAYADTSLQQNKLQKKISNASSQLKSSRSKSRNLKKIVHQAEDKLNDISKKLHSTEQKINRLSTNLIKSNKERSKLLVKTNQQKDALAQQMQALYTSGKQSHLRLLLKQDDPSDISRTVKYFEYMNKHRLKKIGLIKTRLNKIKTLQTQINKDSKTLIDLQNTQRGRKSLLRKVVKEKELALKKQKKVVYTQEQKLAKLRKEEARVQGLIKKLAEKRKREERERLQKIAKARAEKAAQAGKIQASKKIAKPKQKAIKATPKKPAKKRIVASVQKHYVPNKPFSTLRGKLAWPVKGRLSKNYGSIRNSKQRWKGVIISAAAGTRVHAIARGKVEFSGRLKGYGYLVIIRHDKNYRSLYAYNRSVYKKEGQIVKAGDVIAAVGNSGSQAQSGLYFEIRRGTAPQNPKRWIR